MVDQWLLFFSSYLSVEITIPSLNKGQAKNREPNERSVLRLGFPVCPRQICLIAHEQHERKKLSKRRFMSVRQTRDRRTEGPMVRGLSFFPAPDTASCLMRSPVPIP
jgi:hypothetical protein